MKPGMVTDWPSRYESEGSYDEDDEEDEEGEEEVEVGEAEPDKKAAEGKCDFPYA